MWATWEEIRSDYYFEGNVGKIQQPNNTHPPICEIICFEGKTSKEIESILKIASDTLSSELGILGNKNKEFPSGIYQVPCALIIGQRSEQTDKKTSLNQCLRELNVPI